MSAPHADPGAFRLLPLKSGDEYTRSAGDGFARARASTDGLLVVTEDRELFIPLAELLEAIEDLVPSRVPPRRAG